MTESDVKKTAILLLKRRDVPNSPWYYLRTDWRRQLGFLVLHATFPIGCLFLGYETGAIVLVAVIVGVKLRDIRWWFVLAKRWPETSEFLDWKKIESIANSNTES